VPNRKETICIDYEERALFLSDVESKTRKSLHVFLTTKPWSNNKNMQARQQGSELRAQRVWGRLFAEYWMHNKIRGVRFNSICGSWSANYVREIHTYSLCGDRGKEGRSCVVESASEYSYPA